MSNEYSLGISSTDSVDKCQTVMNFGKQYLDELRNHSLSLDSFSFLIHCDEAAGPICDCADHHRLQAQHSPVPWLGLPGGSRPVRACAGILAINRPERGGDIRGLKTSTRKAACGGGLAG